MKLRERETYIELIGDAGNVYVHISARKNPSGSDQGDFYEDTHTQSKMTQVSARVCVKVCACVCVSLLCVANECDCIQIPNLHAFALLSMMLLIYQSHEMN